MVRFVLTHGRMTRINFARTALVASVLSLFAATASAENWGTLTPYACKTLGVRTKGAVLWGIPFGKDWKKECEAASNPSLGRPPDRCVEHGGNEWGEWDVAITDPKNPEACPHFGGWDGNGCSQDPHTGFGEHIFAVVWDIPDGMDWNSVCNSMTLDTFQSGDSKNHAVGRHPDRCTQHDGHEWAEYWIEDADAQDECIADAIKAALGGN